LKQRRAKRGFTLIEVMLAVAISGLVLSGSLIFLLSFTGIWGQRSLQRVTESHFIGVTRALDAWFEEARVSGSLRWGEPEQGGQSEPLLRFTLEGPVAFLNPDSFPSLGVEVYLQIVEGEGLWVIWRTELQEFESERDYRRLLLSPAVTGFRFHYRQEDNRGWRSEDRPWRDVGAVYPSPHILEVLFREEDGRERSARLWLGGWTQEEADGGTPNTEDLPTHVIF
jgi:prepilin-type N-terminal cleavage/methylation domain-containing protein